MKKIIIGIFATILLASAAVFANGTTKKADCCAKESACCHTGSSCCSK